MELFCFQSSTICPKAEPCWLKTESLSRIQTRAEIHFHMNQNPQKGNVCACDSHNRLHSTSTPATCSPCDPALVCEGNEVPSARSASCGAFPRVVPGLVPAEKAWLSHRHIQSDTCNISSPEVVSTALLLLNSHANKAKPGGAAGTMALYAPPPSICPYVMATLVRSLMFFWLHWGSGDHVLNTTLPRKRQLKDGNGWPGGTLESTNNRRNILTIRPSGLCF